MERGASAGVAGALFVGLPNDCEAYSIAGEFAYPASAYYPILEPYQSEHNLNFQTLEINGEKLLGLFERYWRQSLENMNYSLILELPVALKPNDLANLDPRRPIIIGSEVFLLSEIQGYDPTANQTTKVILLKK